MQRNKNVKKTTSSDLWSYMVRRVGTNKENNVSTFNVQGNYVTWERRT
jgi:hypothetical protein